MCVLSFEEKKRVYIFKNLHLTEEKCEREIEVVDIWKHNIPEFDVNVLQLL